jgi:hypothetical protein
MRRIRNSQSEKIMTPSRRTTSELADKLNDKIAFLKYAADMLNQFSRKSNVLGLKQTHYFVSMAALDASENLVQLQRQLSL